MVAQRMLAGRLALRLFSHASLLRPLLANLREIGIARVTLLLLEPLKLALLEQPPAPRLRPADEFEIAQHAGKLIHGQSLRGFVLVVGIAAMEIGDDEIGRPVVMDEMPAHPLAISLGRPRHGGVDRVVDLADQGARWAYRRRLPRRVEDREGQEPEINADGGEQRDQVASGYGLPAIGSP